MTWMTRLAATTGKKRECPILRDLRQRKATGGDAPFLGIGELWFDDKAGADSAQVTAEWKAVLTDAVTFIDMSRVTVGWAEEYEIV